MNKLLLSLLLVAAPAFADDANLQHYTARAEGSLTIGTDGRVLDVELAGDENLGKDVIAGYKERIRAWRFEPVIEDGKPVVAKGLMQLALVAEREKGVDSAKFGIRHVQFMDPPGAPSPVTATKLTPPSYPSSALRDGVGAEVGMVLQLDAQGGVVSAAVERMELLGVTRRQGHLANHEAQFRRSAERIAKEWKFDVTPGQDVVRVPVRYAPPQYAAGWVPTVFRPVTLPEWVQLRNDTAQALELSAGGLALSTQIKLLTPLDGA